VTMTPVSIRDRDSLPIRCLQPSPIRQHSAGSIFFVCSSSPPLCSMALLFPCFLCGSALPPLLPMLCSFYSALLGACYLWLHLLWMHKSIFVFTVDRTMTSSSCITSDYDPKTDRALKGNLGDPGWKYIYWPNLQNKDVVACTLCGISFYGGI
jgi:hypothetical protein